MTMLFYISILAAISAFVLLVILSTIDIKRRILPNEFVLGFAVSGVVFHTCLGFEFLSMEDMGLGAFIGGGILYMIRQISNYFHEDDTLGLGDVKLMAAGGLWLGPEFILLGMTIGAFLGFIHGSAVGLYVMHKTKVKLNLGKMSVPAGPGFAIGLIIAQIIFFWPHLGTLL